MSEKQIQCPVCLGEGGYYRTAERDWGGEYEHKILCEECQGDGWIIEQGGKDE